MSKPRKEKKEDTSVHVHQNPKIKQDLHIREFKWTDKQINFINIAAQKETKCILVDGLWGTGKSLLAVYSSLKLLNEKKVDEIIYIRNCVESTKMGSVGFIPGSPLDKIAPFVQICYDKLEELLPRSEVNFLKNENRVTCHHVGYLRGLSWNCKAIIVDEASCMTKEDLFLILSRVGEYSKVFVIGDTFQNDIGGRSGFADMIKCFNDAESVENGVHVLEFKEESDILRSKFLRFIMKKIGASSHSPSADWAPGNKTS